MGSLFGGSKPPPPPDPALQSQRQQEDIARQAQQTQNYKRPEYQENWAGGTTQWKQTGVDANGNPTFSVVQGLSDPSRAYLGGMQGLGQAYADAAGNFLGNRPPLDSMAAFNQADQYWQQANQPYLDRQAAELRTRLANQGLDPNSEAGRNAMDDLAKQQAQARASFLTQAQSQFFNQGLAGRQQQQNEFGLYNPALSLSGAALTAGAPNFADMNVGQADTAGLYNTAYKQQFDAWNAEQQRKADMMGGIGKLALGIGMAPMTGGTSLIGTGLSGLGSAMSGWGNSYGAAG